MKELAALALAMILLDGCAGIRHMATPEEASQKNSLDWTIESEPRAPTAETAAP